MKAIYIPIIIILSIGFISCEKEDPVIPNEEELITTLKLNFHPVAGGNVVEFMFQDLDGDGGDAPIITSGILEPNTTYMSSIGLLNELENPPLDITEEVEEEGAAHQVFFETTAANISFSYADEDINGNPIGIKTTAQTGEASYGKLTIILRHLPVKPNDGTADNAGGETDIEVSFDVEIR